MAPWPQAKSMNHTANQEEETISTDLSSVELPPEAAAALGTASKPKDDTLYEELLRFHSEEEGGDAETVHTDRHASIGSEEDRKPPAKPSTLTPSNHEENTNRVVSEQIVSNGTVRNHSHHDSRPSSSHGNTPPPTLNQEEEEEVLLESHSLFEKPRAEEEEEDVISHVQKFHHQLSGPPPASLYQQAYHHETMHSPTIFSTTTSSDGSQAQRPQQQQQQQQSSYCDSMPLGYAEIISQAQRRSPPSAHTTQHPCSPPLSKTTSSHTPPVSKSSFYESALQASGQVSPQSQHDLIAQDEKLARELSDRLELEDYMQREQQTAQLNHVDDDVVVVADLSQLEIMNKIRQEAERKQLEAVLRQSGVAGGTAEYIHNSNTAMADYLLSQQLAMEECQHEPRRPMMRRSSSERSATNNGEIPYRVSMEHYAPRPNNNNKNKNSPPPLRRSFTTSGVNSTTPHHDDELLQRGSLETQEAIANGRAHVVQCQGCGGLLHAPMYHSLVYCPNCKTVSPGQTYIARDDRGSLRRQRGTQGGGKR